MLDNPTNYRLRLGKKGLKKIHLGMLMKPPESKIK